MPEYLAPGVYVEEVDRGPKPIEGVSTSTSGMVGITERGPVGVATLVTSFADFRRKFGGYLDDRKYTGTTWYLPHAVEGFFTNGGKRLYVVRVLPNKATAASIKLFDRGTLDTKDSVTPTEFRGILAAKAEQKDQLLLINNDKGLKDGSWLLLQDGQASEYVQLGYVPPNSKKIAPNAGVVAVSKSIQNNWNKGTRIQGYVDQTNTLLRDSTKLAADVSKGTFLLPVEDKTLLAGATSYRIGNDPDPNNLESRPKADNGSVTLGAGLAQDHNIEAAVVKPTISKDPLPRALLAVPYNTHIISLDDRVGLEAGGWLRLTGTAAGGSTAPKEFLQIQSLASPRTSGADPGEVTLMNALGSAFKAGNEVELLHTLATSPGPRKGTNTLTLDFSEGLKAGRWLRLSNPLNPTPQEIVQIKRVTSSRTVELKQTLQQNFNGVTVVAVELLCTLTENARATDRRIKIDCRAGLKAGKWLRLTGTAVGGAAAPKQLVKIQSLTSPRTSGADPGEVTLMNALGSAFKAGNEVELLHTLATSPGPGTNTNTLTLDFSEGLKAGRWLRLSHPLNPTPQEIVQIKRVTGPKKVELEQPLSQNFSGVTTVAVELLRTLSKPPTKVSVINIDNRLGLKSGSAPKNGQKLQLTRFPTESNTIHSITLPGTVQLTTGTGTYTAEDRVEIKLVRTMTTPPSGPNKIQLDNIVGLKVGQRLRLINWTTGSKEEFYIKKITPTTPPDISGEIELTQSLKAKYAAVHEVEAELIRKLTTPPSDRYTITLDTRVDLVDNTGSETGQWLRLINRTTGRDEEVRIQRVPDRSATKPADPGDVILEKPLPFNFYQAGHDVEVELLRIAVTPIGATNTIKLDNCVGLAKSMKLRLIQRTRPNKEDVPNVQIRDLVLPRITTGRDPGRVVLEDELTGYNVGDIVEVELLDPAPRKLTQDVYQGSTKIALDDCSWIQAAWLPKSQVHFLKVVDKQGNVEFVRIDTVNSTGNVPPDPGVIALEWPLQRNYEKGDTVTLLRDIGSDTQSTLLARDADPGDGALVLGDADAYQKPGTYLRIESIGAANSEYHQIPAGGKTAALRLITQPVQKAHAAGTVVQGRSRALEVKAIDKGEWGNQLHVIANQESLPLLRKTKPKSPLPLKSNPKLLLESTVGIEAGSILEFCMPTTDGKTKVVFRQKVDNVDGDKITFGQGGLIQDVTNGMFVRTCEFQLKVQLTRKNPRTNREEVVVEENFRQLSLDPRHSRYIVKVIGPIKTDERTEGESDLIRVSDRLTPNQAEATLRTGLDILEYTPSGRSPRPLGLSFTGGDDNLSAVDANTYKGQDSPDPPTRTGLHALKNIEEIAIVSAPGQTDIDVQEALLNHCELLRYRFAVLDSEVDSKLADVQDHRSLYDSKYGAIYYPWLKISDPFPENPRLRTPILIPPSGYVMGIYARSDIERGVHKAPGNEVIRGIRDLEFKINKEEQDILNPRNINVLRNFRDNNRGLRVWGVRTVSSDPDWKYVNVRRLFIFIEHSIDRGTQWAVFEPNDEPTWGRLRRTVSAFLNNVWRDGALQGSSPDQAFYVKCDRTTMTQYDIDNGRLIMEIGIAPVKPAEFVIFRIGQWTGGSELEEF